MNLVHLAFAMAAFGTVCLVGCAYGLWRIWRGEKQQQRLDNWDIGDAGIDQHITKWTDDMRKQQREEG